MEFILDYATLAKKLENQELESQVSPLVYEQLLAIYLYLNDLTSAKFLWKRIPQEIKESNEELTTIWLVGRHMWKRNYSEIYNVINSNRTWPNHLKKIMNLIAESIRERSIALINKAYSNISIADVSNLLGLTREDTLQLAEKHGWICDEEGEYFQIKSNDNKNGNRLNQENPNVLDNGTELLTKFTDYIVFLENSANKQQK